MTRIRKEETTPLLGCDGQCGRVRLLPGSEYPSAQSPSMIDYLDTDVKNGGAECIDGSKNPANSVCIDA